MKKILIFAIIALGFMFSQKLNSSAYPAPYRDFISSEPYSLYLKYKNIISTYVHSSELPDWAQMSPDKDGYEGAGTLALYEYINSLNPGVKPKTLIVAVMDTGIDTDHPEFKDKIWNNEKEINGQPGVDDDGNGYVDDFHGWNFLGKAVNLSLEVTRELKRLKKENVSETDAYYKKVKDEYNKKKQETNDIYSFAKETAAQYLKAEKKLQEKNYPTEPDKLKEIVESLKGEYKESANVILMVKALYGIERNELFEIEKDYAIKVKCLFDTTSTSVFIGDNPDLLAEKNYGDNDVFTKGATHGTHVTGIISANKKGIGQAPFVQIMSLRVVPDEGDERDKDIANGIIYAVDNGASIINMSAGKYFSKDYEYVTEAIRYAESKGVLFVISAGNEGTDAVVKRNFPPKFYYENGEMKYFSNMIVVGANTWMKKWNEEKDPDNLCDGYDLSAPFSNYSDKVVDLFAPGMEINSTVPGGKYERLSGTSMAAPVVSGIAAIIKGYFPDASASDIKIILTGSARKYDGLKVKIKDAGSKMQFSSLSKSGGVIDALSAFNFAKEKFGM